MPSAPQGAKKGRESGPFLVLILLETTAPKKNAEKWLHDYKNPLFWGGEIEKPLEV